MPITKPQLLPKAGYVEVIDENGNHVYKPIAETEEKFRKEQAEKQQMENINASISSIQETIDFLVLDALNIEEAL